mmetsp:Transcript_69414/g.115056  ORF Transcript_69414/g.115056 Transcript_69414/m.115056 type:complete len:83 (+) Transcript_69414:683-931(+)
MAHGGLEVAKVGNAGSATGNLLTSVARQSQIVGTDASVRAAAQTQEENLHLNQGLSQTSNSLSNWALTCCAPLTAVGRKCVL